MFCSRLGSFSRSGNLSGSKACFSSEVLASGDCSGLGGFGSFGFPHQDIAEDKTGVCMFYMKKKSPLELLERNWDGDVSTTAYLPEFAGGCDRKRLLMYAVGASIQVTSRSRRQLTTGLGSSTEILPRLLLTCNSRHIFETKAPRSHPSISHRRPNSSPPPIRSHEPTIT